MKGREDVFTLLIWIVTLSPFVVTAKVVFTEEPGPGPVLLPVGGQIIFNCSVSPEDMIIGWRVFVPDVNILYFTDSKSNNASLALLGITVRKDGSLSSQLIINATQENLLTYVLCEARIGMDDNTVTQSGVNVTVYGPPDIPINLSLSVKDDFLTVIWMSSTIPNVSLTFDLVLTNLRTSSRKEVTIYGTQRHQFTEDDVQACDVLEVLVAARNNAGVSSQATINSTLPVLPDINMLKLILSEDNNGVTLTVTFMTPTPCLVNPVTSYTLAVILEDSEQKMTEQTTRSPFGPAVSLEVEGLMEKATYSYSIAAINSISRATTATVSFTTFDVQGVSVCLVEGSTYSIHCSFIAQDNNANMCSYVLVGVVEGAGDVNGTIDETSFVDEEIPNIQDYGRILVYDEDNVLAINVTLDSENIASCSTTLTDITETTTKITTAIMTSKTVFIIIGVLVCMAFICLVAIIAVIVAMHGCSPTKEKVENCHVAIIKDVNNHVSQLQDDKMKEEVGAIELHPDELLQSEPVYSALSNDSSRKKVTPSRVQDASIGTYSELNDIKMPIYHVLESNQIPVRPSAADQNLPLLPESSHLSGGDTPPPVTKPDGMLIYSEIGAISAGNQAY